MAALALLMTACSNDEIDMTAQQPTTQAEGITITAKLAPKTSGATRALSEGANKMISSWAVDESIAILYQVGGVKKEADATITAVDDDGTATISFTVDENTDNNTPCTLVYPSGSATEDGPMDFYDKLSYQWGTLDPTYDTRVGEGIIHTASPSLTITTQPQPQYAIFKFTLGPVGIPEDGYLYIKDGNNNLITRIMNMAVTPRTEIFAALPPATAATYIFSMDTDDNRYTKTGTATIEAGMYYQTALTLTARYPKAMADADASDIGCVIAANGQIYANATKANEASTARAMIAYVGTASNCTHGLAVALEDVSTNQLTMDNSGEDNGGKTASQILNTWAGSHGVTGGTWRIPTVNDWKYMLSGCGGRAYTATLSNDMQYNYGHFMDMIEAAGGTNTHLFNYWSSNNNFPGETNFHWVYDFGNTQFCGYGDYNGCYLRACLNF